MPSLLQRGLFSLLSPFQRGFSCVVGGVPELWNGYGFHRETYAENRRLQERVRNLEKALQDSSFDISDKDRSDGTFYIRYTGDEEDDEGGWFSDWWVSDDEAEEEPADTGWFGGWLFGGENEPETVEILTEQDFVLSIEEQSADVALITIARRDGVALASGQASQLLSVIKSNLN